MYEGTSPRPIDGLRVPEAQEMWCYGRLARQFLKSETGLGFFGLRSNFHLSHRLGCFPHFGAEPDIPPPDRWRTATESSRNVNLRQAREATSEAETPRTARSNWTRFCRSGEFSFLAAFPSVSRFRCGNGHNASRSLAYECANQQEVWSYGSPVRAPRAYC